MSQTSEPEIVNVWICCILGSEREMCARATRTRAEEWVEDRLGSAGEWCVGPGAKDLFRTDGAVNGMVALAPLPDCRGMVVSDGVV